MSRHGLAIIGEVPDADKPWRNKFLVARLKDGSPIREWGFNRSWLDASNEAKGKPTLTEKEKEGWKKY